MQFDFKIQKIFYKRLANIMLSHDPIDDGPEFNVSHLLINQLSNTFILLLQPELLAILEQNLFKKVETVKIAIDLVTGREAAPRRKKRVSKIIEIRIGLDAIPGKNSTET